MHKNTHFTNRVKKQAKQNDLPQLYLFKIKLLIFACGLLCKSAAHKCPTSTNAAPIYIIENSNNL